MPRPRHHHSHDEFCGEHGDNTKAGGILYAGGEQMNKAVLMQKVTRGAPSTLVDNSEERVAEFSEALDRHRQSARDRGLSASVIIFCTDRKGMLVDVATVVTSYANNIMNVQTDIYTPGGTSAFKYTVTVESLRQLEELMDAVQQVPDVTRVIRGKDYGPKADVDEGTR